MVWWSSKEVWWSRGRVGNWLIGFLRELLVFCEWKSDSPTVPLLSRATRANPSGHYLKKSDWAKRNWAKSKGSDLILGIKNGKSSKKLPKMYKTIIFCSNRLLLIAICSNQEWITHVVLFYRVARAICSQSLFCYERPEQIAHGCSFVKSDKSNSLTVAHFKRATRTNCSQLLNNMYDRCWAKEQRVKERIPNPDWQLYRQEQAGEYLIIFPGFLPLQVPGFRHRVLFFCMLMLTTRWVVGSWQSTMSTATCHCLRKSLCRQHTG